MKSSAMMARLLELNFDNRTSHISVLRNDSYARVSHTSATCWQQRKGPRAHNLLRPCTHHSIRHPG